MQIISKNDKDRRDLYNYTPFRSVFDDFFRFPFDDLMVRMPSNMGADMWVEGDNVMVKVGIPGVKKDDIKIEIDRDMLTISAQSKVEEKGDKKNYYFKSFQSSFEQSFSLPFSVNESESKAKYEDGVLMLTLPKSKSENRKMLKID